MGRVFEAVYLLLNSAKFRPHAGPKEISWALVLKTIGVPWKDLHARLNAFGVHELRGNPALVQRIRKEYFEDRSSLTPELVKSASHAAYVFFRWTVELIRIASLP